MSEYAYPASVIRAAEVPLLDAGVPLMARASWALAQVSAAVLRGRDGGTGRSQPRVSGSRVCVLAGPGNNAGDALFAAAHLAGLGAQISIIRLFGRTHLEGLAAAQRAGARVVALPGDLSLTDSWEALEELVRSDLVLDGILGTGGRRGLPDPVRELIARWRRAAIDGFEPRDQRVIAVDLPSDLSPEPDSAAARIHADHTVTFGGLKTELLDPRLREFTGRIHTIDIGLPLDPATAAAEVLLASDLARDYTVPGAADHKYTRGVLGIVAGSRTYPGAGLLTSGAAVGCAIGMTRYLGSAEVGERILDHHAEVVLAPGRLDALVVGPGDPEAEFAERALDAVAGTDVPIVLDAGGLDLVAAVTTGEERAGSSVPQTLGHRLRTDPVVLTPHAGELARLLTRLRDASGEVTSAMVRSDPLTWATTAAALTGHIVLLKGSQTIIACPGGFVVLPEPGPASLAAAGSGDVLAGILGALLAGAHARAARLGDRDLAHLAGLAVLLHNAAGRLAVNATGLVDGVEAVTSALIHGDPDGILDG